MSKIRGPKGRANLPKELLQFGVHLVYSEGTETEPKYVESIKKEIASKYNCKQNKIDIINAGEKKEHDTIYLVEYVKKDVLKRIKSGEQIDHIWIFFDKDDFPIKNFIEANKMIEQMNDSKGKNSEDFKYNLETNISWHSCPSNEAFELWFCQYFSYYQGEHTRQDYINFLNNKFDYSKNKENLHQILTNHGGNIDNAIKYSKRLKGLLKLDNPSTKVYEFAEYFLPYMKNDNKK